MALFDKFGMQVLLMHSIFLTIRAATIQLKGDFDIFNNYQNIGGSIASYIALRIGFRDQLSDLGHYRAVGILYLLACLAALVTVNVLPDMEVDFARILKSVSDYGE